MIGDININSLDYESENIVKTFLILFFQLLQDLLELQDTTQQQ